MTRALVRYELYHDEQGAASVPQFAQILPNHERVPPSPRPAPSPFSRRNEAAPPTPRRPATPRVRAASTVFEETASGTEYASAKKRPRVEPEQVDDDAGLEDFLGGRDASVVTPRGCYRAEDGAVAPPSRPKGKGRVLDLHPDKEWE
jgi:hypothetical protein